MQDMDPELYYQAQYNYSDRRDAFILGVEDAPYPAMFWRTAIGGRRSDRGWGIAASEEEVYVCGATASSETPDLFPLREFDTESDVDYFFRYFLGGWSDMFAPWRSFRLLMDYEWSNFDGDIIEGFSLQHDGFVASFTMNEAVGLPPDPMNPVPTLRIWPMDLHHTYMMQAPNAATWTGHVIDAAGRIVTDVRFNGLSAMLQLDAPASGLYLLTLSDPTGVRYSAKFVVP